jgi:hypothetical protein
LAGPCGAKIHDFVPGGANARDQFFLQRKPAVICGNADTHDWFLALGLA